MLLCATPSTQHDVYIVYFTSNKSKHHIYQTGCEVVNRRSTAIQCRMVFMFIVQYIETLSICECCTQTLD